MNTDHPPASGTTCAFDGTIDADATTPVVRTARAETVTFLN